MTDCVNTQCIVGGGIEEKVLTAEYNSLWVHALLSAGEGDLTGQAESARRVGAALQVTHRLLGVWVWCLNLIESPMNIL